MDDSKKIIELLENMKKQLTRIEEKIGIDTPTRNVIKPKDENHEAENFIDKIDSKKLEYLNDLESVRDQCFCLLNFLSKETGGKGGLTTDEMKQILAEKFGLTTITIYNISVSMKKATGKYVTRNKISDKTEKYRYQILTKGKEYIETKIQNLKK